MTVQQNKNITIRLFHCNQTDSQSAVPFVLLSDIHNKGEFEAIEMLMFVLLSLSISSLHSHPASPIDQSDRSCRTLKSFEHSLEEAKQSCTSCLDSEIKSENFS